MNIYLQKLANTTLIAKQGVGGWGGEGGGGGIYIKDIFPLQRRESQRIISGLDLEGSIGVLTLSKESSFWAEQSVNAGPGCLTTRVVSG